MRIEDFNIFKLVKNDDTDWKNNKLYTNKTIPIIDYNLIKLLDELKIYLMGYDIVITCIYDTSGHSTNSYHYKGKAMDFYILKNKKMNKYKDSIKLIESFLLQNGYDEMVGLGIYPQKNIFHIDTRGHKARWGYIRTNNKEYKETSYEKALEIANKL
jgi:uncharacterized protein YcbK (DUF882 family)